VLIRKRAELHNRIAEILEELHSDRTEEFAPLIAYHFYSGQDPRSLKYDLLAGDKAARLFANVEAAVHFRRALEVAKRNSNDHLQMASIFTRLGQVLELVGHHQQALEIYDEMLAF